MGNSNAKNGATAEQTERTRIDSHEELQEVITRVGKILQSHPQKALLFMVDYQSAIRDLGFELSDDVDQHLGQVLRKAKLCPKPNRQLYEDLTSEKVAPIEVFAWLQESNGQSTTFPKNLPKHQSDKLAKKAAEIQDPKQAVSIANACGFSVIIQITQDAVDEIVREAFEFEKNQWVWEKEELFLWKEVGLNAEVQYRLELKQPKVTLGNSAVDEVSVSIGALADVVLDLDFVDLPGQRKSDRPHKFPLRAGVEITFLASVKIGPAATVGKSAVFADLRGIRGLRIKLNNNTLPHQAASFLEELLERIAIIHFWEQKVIPLSFEVDAIERAGIPIKSLHTKIIPPGPNFPGTLTLALDTTGKGKINSVQYFVPSGKNFAFVTTKEFLIDQVWPYQASNYFPKKDGDLELHNPSLELGKGYFQARVNATYEVFDGECASWHVDAVARVWSGFEPFEKEKIWYVRPYRIKTDIDIDAWDQFIIASILGGFLMLLGIGGMVARSVIARIIMNAIIGLAEDEITEQIGGFNFGIRAVIPGSRRLAISSTPVAPAISPEGISAFGTLSFIDA